MVIFHSNSVKLAEGSCWTVGNIMKYEDICDRSTILETCGNILLYLFVLLLELIHGIIDRNSCFLFPGFWCIVPFGSFWQPFYINTAWDFCHSKEEPGALKHPSKMIFSVTARVVKWEMVQQKTLSCRITSLFNMTIILNHTPDLSLIMEV
jgi:hypothetical protein